jgi:hypothetical protein
MGARARATDAYVLVCMVAAAVAGRLLDAAGLLPGVHETGSVRGGASAWLVALLMAAVLGVAAAARWSATRSLRAIAWLVVPGQLGVFFAAEAVVRLASAQGPLDPDGIVGALLQAGIALVLLLALTAAWVVAGRCTPLGLGPPQLPNGRVRCGGHAFLPTSRPLVLQARGPPRTAGT